MPGDQHPAYIVFEPPDDKYSKAFHEPDQIFRHLRS
jgi:hypothetical protein